MSCTAAEVEKALTRKCLRGCTWWENKPRATRVLENGLRERREENVEKVIGTVASLNVCKPIAGASLLRKEATTTD